jgi:hypothetical protein
MLDHMFLTHLHCAAPMQTQANVDRDAVQLYRLAGSRGRASPWTACRGDSTRRLEGDRFIDVVRCGGSGEPSHSASGAAPVCRDGDQQPAWRGRARAVTIALVTFFGSNRGR